MNCLRVLSGVLLISLFVASCASVPPSTTPCMRLGGNSHACLLAPSAWPEVNATHLLTYTQDGRQERLLGHLEIDDAGVRLAGFSLMGVELFSVVYDGHEVHSQALEKRFDSKLVMLVLELSLADPKRIQTHLKGLELERSITSQGEVRTLVRHGKPLIHIVGGNTHEPDKASFHISFAKSSAKLSLTPLKE